MFGTLPAGTLHGSPTRTVKNHAGLLRTVASDAWMESGKNHADFLEITLELLVSPVEAARRLGIGRTQMFDLIGRGEVKSVKIGKLRRIPVAALTDLNI